MRCEVRAGWPDCDNDDSDDHDDTDDTEQVRSDTLIHRSGLGISRAFTSLPKVPGTR